MLATSSRADNLYFRLSGDHRFVPQTGLNFTQTTPSWEVVHAILRGVSRVYPTKQSYKDYVHVLMEV
jgi:hypothetical protein